MLRRIRNHPLAAGGAVGWLFALIQIIRQLLQLGGDIDFIVTRAQEPGWVGMMVEYIVNPPNYMLLIVFIVGSFLIWFDLRRAQARPILKSVQTNASELTSSLEGELKDVAMFTITGFDATMNNCTIEINGICPHENGDVLLFSVSTSDNTDFEAFKWHRNGFLKSGEHEGTSELVVSFPLCRKNLQSSKLKIRLTETQAQGTHKHIEYTIKAMDMDEYFRSESGSAIFKGSLDPIKSIQIRASMGEIVHGHFKIIKDQSFSK